MPFREWRKLIYKGAIVLDNHMNLVELSFMQKDGSKRRWWRLFKRRMHMA